MTDSYTYNQLIEELERLYNDGQHQAALDRLTPLMADFPEPAERRELLLWQVVLTAQEGLFDLSMAVLWQAVMNEGFWYPPVWLTQEADFAPLHGRPGYREIIDLCAERVAALEAAMEPVRAEAVPPGDGPHPLLLALHGNESSPKGWVSKFRLAVTAGWLVALPQSRQISGPEKFIWDDRDQAVEEITAHFADLQVTHPLDTNRVVLGGFSMGAETTLFLALTGLIPTRGVIGVIPGGPFMAQPEQWTGLLEWASPPDDLRVYLIAGQEDFFYQGTVRLTEILEEAGIACRLVSIPRMGHDLPPNFRDNLKDALQFVMGEGE